MELENIVYATVQMLHNFGAVAVVGCPFSTLCLTYKLSLQRQLARLTLYGWLMQAVSGVMFGLASLYFYGQFPDMPNIAYIALAVKVTCAMVGVVCSILYLKRVFLPKNARSIWWVLMVASVVALSSAAILRWFS